MTEDVLISVEGRVGRLSLNRPKAIHALNLPMGQARVWKLGVDAVPTVKMCGDLSKFQGELDTEIKSIGDGTVDVDALVAGGASASPAAS